MGSCTSKQQIFPLNQRIDELEENIKEMSMFFRNCRDKQQKMIFSLTQDIASLRDIIYKTEFNSVNAKKKVDVLQQKILDYTLICDNRIKTYDAKDNSIIVFPVSSEN